MVSTEWNAIYPTIITVCKIHAGEKNIVIPETLELEGSIRCLHENDAQVRERFAAIAKRFVMRIAVLASCRLSVEIHS